MSTSSLKIGNFIRLTLNQRNYPCKTGIVMCIYPFGQFEECMIQILQPTGDMQIFFSSEILKLEVLSEHQILHHGPVLEK